MSDRLKWYHCQVIAQMLINKHSQVFFRDLVGTTPVGDLIAVEAPNPVRVLSTRWREGGDRQIDALIQVPVSEMPNDVAFGWVPWSSLEMVP